MANALTDSLVDDETPGEPETDAPEATETDAPSEPEKPARITPIGRRAKAAQAQEALMKELQGLRESVSKQGETYREHLERIQRENAELRGTVQGLYIQRPQHQERQVDEKLPDPAELRRQARKALEQKDFDEYERLTGEAIEASVMGKVAPRFAQQQAPQATQQTNPLLQMVAGQYIDVVSDRAAMEIAQAHDRILAAQGMPETPDRWKRAFEEGRRYMGAKNGNPKPQFSQQSRGVLSGVPTQRGENGGGGEGTTRGVRLTATEREYAKRFKMKADDYAAELAAMHPERIEDG